MGEASRSAYSTHNSGGVEVGGGGGGYPCGGNGTSSETSMRIGGLSYLKPKTYVGRRYGERPTVGLRAIGLNESHRGSVGPARVKQGYSNV